MRISDHAKRSSLIKANTDFGVMPNSQIRINYAQIIHYSVLSLQSTDKIRGSLTVFIALGIVSCHIVLYCCNFYFFLTS